MSQIAITAEMELTTGTSVTLKTVTDGLGVDIKEKFERYCAGNDLPLQSQADIEYAAGEYAKDNP